MSQIDVFAENPKSVILSEQSESKDLCTNGTFTVIISAKILRLLLKICDFLQPLRMTYKRWACCKSFCNTPFYYIGTTIIAVVTMVLTAMTMVKVMIPAEPKKQPAYPGIRGF